MESHLNHTKSGRLGSRLRGKLAEAYGQRGHHKSDLCYAYSPRTNRDWVLQGDLQWDHFVLTEADPRVKDANYAPDPVDVQLQDGSIFHAEFDAIVTFADCSIDWCDIGWAKQSGSSEELRSKSKHAGQLVAATRAGARLTCLTESELQANLQKLANWRRVLVWIGASRSYSLAPYMTDVAAFLHTRGSVTLGDIETLSGKTSFANYAAAAFRGITEGKFFSNLDAQPLSLETTISVEPVLS